MFNSLTGTITQKNQDSVYINTGGVEWDVSMPARDIDLLPLTGNEGRIFTWLQHSEDLMKLFGFSSAERRGIFLELLKVQGIGPKGALKILGSMSEDELQKALDTEDLPRLERIPGLGHKTAQKMILALKGKLNTTGAAEVRASGPYADLVESLAGMGYERHSALDAISAADASLDKTLKGAAREKELFRQAVLNLSGVRGQ
jgi:Holliday junction DNA helicase RuvA